MNILIVTPMVDQQTGLYIHSTLVEMGHKVAFFDWRLVAQDHGVVKMNSMLIEGIDKLTPDLTIIVKGLGITGETIKTIRSKHKKMPMVGMIFDAKLGNKLVKDVQPYVDMIKELDFFYTTDVDAIAELKPLGIKPKFLAEACFPPMNREVVFNSVQKRRFAADISFIGSIDPIHRERMEFLHRLHEEGFDFKIYGEVIGDAPAWIDDHHTGFAAVNDYHSIVCQSSKIVIGTDEYRYRKYGFSARLYRVLCTGGFYLTSKVNGIEDFFTPGVHLDTFDNPNELVEKVIKYLSDDELRGKIAKAGQKEVLEKHTFEMRLNQILEDTKTKALNTDSTPYIIR